MNLKEYITYFFPKIIRYRVSKLGLGNPGNHITLTYSVTAACQSKCKTCNIGLEYQKNQSFSNK